MCNQLLDLYTLAKLKEAAPRPTDTPPNEARMVIKVLGKHTSNKNKKIGMDDQPYFEMYLVDMYPPLPKALSHKRVGSLCRAMGLVMRRRNTGYLVAWSKDQLSILWDYFELGG